MKKLLLVLAMSLGVTPGVFAETVVFTGKLDKQDPGTPGYKDTLTVSVPVQYGNTKPANTTLVDTSYVNDLKASVSDMATVMQTMTTSKANQSDLDNVKALLFGSTKSSQTTTSGNTTTTVVTNSPNAATLENLRANLFGDSNNATPAAAPTVNNLPKVATTQDFVNSNYDFKKASATATFEQITTAYNNKNESDGKLVTVDLAKTIVKSTIGDATDTAINERVAGGATEKVSNGTKVTSVAYVTESAAATLKSANAYTDTATEAITKNVNTVATRVGAVEKKVDDLGNRVDNVEKGLKQTVMQGNAAGAAAIAVANMPAPLPGKSNFAVGQGMYGGQSAMAVGMATSIKWNDKDITVKASLTKSAFDTGGGVGIAYNF